MLKRSLRVFFVMAALGLWGVDAHAEPKKTVTTTTKRVSDEVETVTDAKRFNIRTNPLNLLIVAPDLDFDIKLLDFLTLGPTFQFLSVSSTSGTSSGTSATLFSVGARANVYLSGEAISSSLLLSPIVELNFISATQGLVSASSNGASFGGTIGYQWVFESGFNLELGAGMLYATSSTTVSNGTQSVVLPGILAGVRPVLDFNLGIAF